MSDVASARVALYGFVLAVLDKPSLEQHEWMTGADFAAAFRALCDRFGVEEPRGPWVGWPADEHESMYLACFEVGLPTPSVVLQASHHNRRAPAPRIIHEHNLVYRLFDAKVTRGNLDQPDHLLNQLAFLIHLDELVLGGARDLQAIGAARRDFIDKHVRSLVLTALESARAPVVPPIYAVTLELLASALDEDDAVSDSWLRHG